MAVRHLAIGRRDVPFAELAVAWTPADKRSDDVHLTYRNIYRQWWKPNYVGRWDPLTDSPFKALSPLPPRPRLSVLSGHLTHLQLSGLPWPTLPNSVLSALNALHSLFRGRVCPYRIGFGLVRTRRWSSVKLGFMGPEPLE
jgi:hypothetical protein